MMKTNFLQLAVVLVFLLPIRNYAQQTDEPEMNPVLTENKLPDKDKKFHIALQDFSFGEISGKLTVSRVGFRMGYALTSKDLLMLGGQFTWNPRDGYSKTIETKLYYRRYFMKNNFKPFVQFGAGMGYAVYGYDYSYKGKGKYYGVYSAGAGVSYRYKRWGFEAGIQSDYNRNTTGRFSISPIVGVSFHF